MVFDKTIARPDPLAGLTGVTLHTLRHTFAGVAADLGYSEFTIAGLRDAGGEPGPDLDQQAADHPGQADGPAKDHRGVTPPNRIGAIRNSPSG